MTRTSVRMSAALFIFLLSAQLAACTVFVLQKENAVLVGKNLDWPLGDGIVVVNPRGQDKTALSAGWKNKLAWRSRFGSVTFNQLGRGFPIGGMNEKGLVIEEASYSPSRYPSNGGYIVNEFQWIQYHLDTCATTGEVTKKLNDLLIAPILARLHYLVCDAAGRTAVVEFINGRARVYAGNDLVVPVMTNTSYANSLNSLGIHQGFGGARIVGPGKESPERFVRAATWVRGLQTLPVQLTPDRAFRILDNVAQQDTQWHIVYDPANLEIRFRTRSNPELRILHMGVFDFHMDDAMADIHDAPPRFQPFSPVANTELLSRVFDCMVRLDLIDGKEAVALRDRLIAHVREEKR